MLIPSERDNISVRLAERISIIYHRRYFDYSKSDLPETWLTVQLNKSMS